MSETMILISDNADAVFKWRKVLNDYDLLLRHFTFNDLSYLTPGTPVIVDSTSDINEDDLLTALGYARSLGASVAVSLPEVGDILDIEDLLYEICDGLVAHHEEEIDYVVSNLIRRNDNDRKKRFEFLTIAPDGESLLAILGNGHCSLISRPIAEEDDGQDIISITLDDNAAHAVIEYEDGESSVIHAEKLLQTNSSLLNELSLNGAKLGSRLKELRLAAHLTQAELAKRTGIHRPNIARVEAGKHTPSLDTVARIASALGVSTTHVFSK